MSRLPADTLTTAAAVFMGPRLRGDDTVGDGCERSSQGAAIFGVSTVRVGVVFMALPFLFSQAIAGDVAAGKTKAQMCAICHGLDGLATMPDAPHIGGESTIYLERQLKAFRSGERKHEQMSIIAQGLSDQDIADVVAWYSSIKVSVTLPDQASTSP